MFLLKPFHSHHILLDFRSHKALCLPTDVWRFAVLHFLVFTRALTLFRWEDGAAVTSINSSALLCCSRALYYCALSDNLFPCTQGTKYFWLHLCMYIMLWCIRSEEIHLIWMSASFTNYRESAQSRKLHLSVNSLGYIVFQINIFLCLATREKEDLRNPSHLKLPQSRCICYVFLLW